MILNRAPVALSFLFMIVAALLSSPARAQLTHAVAVNLFGPTQFATGPESSTTDSFTVPPLVDPPYTLTVERLGRVEGEIVLNGVKIRTPEAQHTYIRLVDLEPSNTLTLRFAGETGSSMTVSIFGYTYQFASDYTALSQLSPESAPGGNVDWRTKGAVTPVKDEGACLADWAFSTTGLVEGAHKIKAGNLSSLSEQELIDCIPSASCDIGSPAEGADYVLMNGIGSEASYPYTAVKGACKSVTPVANLSEIFRVPPGDEATLQAAVAAQPISVVLNGNWYSTYTDGIANPDCNGPLVPDYRAALIIGYGETNGSPYWLVKNSLGAAWGENGFFRILRGQNACGIANYAIGGQ